MKTALLIVDMVRDFTDPNGLVFYPENRKILPEIKEVLELCRSKNCLIVYCSIVIELVSLIRRLQQCDLIV